MDVEETGPRVWITPILGCIEAQGAVVEGRGAPNSTRWVFDVEGVCGPDPITIQLQEHRWLRQIRPGLMSFSITPTSKGGAKALLWAQAHNGCLLLYAYREVGGTSEFEEAAGGAAEFSCRVAIDVMHTATR